MLFNGSNIFVGWSSSCSQTLIKKHDIVAYKNIQ